MRGLTNGTAGAKTVSVSTTTDLPTVTSNAFTVAPAGALTTPTVAIADPSPATGAITRYVTDFRVSSTGGLSGEAGSSITVTLPAGTGTTSWQSGTVRNLSTAADVGSCRSRRAASRAARSSRAGSSTPTTSCGSPCAG